MRPYELLRPGGEPSGVWACGECGAIHFFEYYGRKPVSETNRLLAEQCCGPRNCWYCGKPTERGRDGQFAYSHPGCPPKYEPPPPHPSMHNPLVRLLYEKMSNICEDRWHSTWLENYEYELWEAFQGRVHPESTIALSPEEREELHALSELAGGWIWCGGIGKSTPQLVSLERWKELCQNHE